MRVVKTESTCTVCFETIFINQTIESAQYHYFASAWLVVHDWCTSLDPTGYLAGNLAMSVKSTPLIARGHTRPVNSLAFSPLEADGQHYLLVSSCKDGTPMLRDGSTGKLAV